MNAEVLALVARIQAGDKRSVARALTLIENGSKVKRPLLQRLYQLKTRAHIIGITGAPGAGKSTLVDQVIERMRSSGIQVGVLAVDPSSPFHQGAVLGDRVRMSRHTLDPGVFIRSVSARGSLGGLALATREMRYVLEAMGCGVILLETVGVGQSEVHVMHEADTVALVLTPETGDEVQFAKSGILEIADVYVVNKRDLPGSDLLVRELQGVVRRSKRPCDLVSVCALHGDGVGDLWSVLQRREQTLRASGGFTEKERARREDTALSIVESKVIDRLRRRAKEDPLWQTLLRDAFEDPYQAAAELLKRLGEFYDDEI